MTYWDEDIALEPVYEQLLSEGIEGLPKVISHLLNEAMKLERSRYLKAELYECCEGRVSHANGFKPK
jgi:hypothetical protein